MRASINLNDTNHNFVKQNLITLYEGEGKRRTPYDEMKCDQCGLSGKRYSLNAVTLDGRTSKSVIHSCPNAPQKDVPKQIKILYVNAVGRQFQNLTPESIHTVIPAPKPYTDDHKGVWVMGNGEPVKVLRNEFEEIK